MSNQCEKFSSENWSSKIQEVNHYLANIMGMQLSNQNVNHQPKTYSKTASFMNYSILNDNQHFVQQYLINFYVSSYTTYSVADVE